MQILHNTKAMVAIVVAGLLVTSSPPGRMAEARACRRHPVGSMRVASLPA